MLMSNGLDLFVLLITTRFILNNNLISVKRQWFCEATPVFPVPVKLSWPQMDCHIWLSSFEACSCSLQNIWVGCAILRGLQQPHSYRLCTWLLRRDCRRAMEHSVQQHTVAWPSGIVCDGKCAWCRWTWPDDASNDHEICLFVVCHHHGFHLSARQETLSYTNTHHWCR